MSKKIAETKENMGSLMKSITLGALTGIVHFLVTVCLSVYYVLGKNSEGLAFTRHVVSQPGYYLESLLKQQQIHIPALNVFVINGLFYTLSGMLVLALVFRFFSKS